MRSFCIAISVISLSCLLTPPGCDARGGAHAAAAHVYYPNASAGFAPVKGPLPTGSNGYAYHPVGAGYWGRRYWGGGGHRYYPSSNDVIYSTIKPVDNSFDEWNRAEARRLRSLPKSAFIKEYGCPSSRGEQQLAVNKSQQVAAKSNPTIH